MEPATIILTRTSGLSQSAREKEFIRLIQLGNVPSWTWTTFCVRENIKVMRDFLSVGTDEDYAWIPLTPAGAQAVLGVHGMRLPNRTEADATFELARDTGGFIPFSSFSPARGETRWGNKAILATQRYNERKNKIGLVDGQKKYVLGLAHGHVVIYGGHSRDGKIVQPYNAQSHSADYLDYSHGIRGVVVV